MNYLKITKYIYLVFGFAMLVLAILDWKDGKNPFMPALFAGLAFFMFFFRNRFQSRFDDRNKPSQP